MSWKSRPTGSLVSSSMDIVLSQTGKTLHTGVTSFGEARKRKPMWSSLQAIQEDQHPFWVPRVRIKVKEQLIKGGSSTPITYRSFTKDFWRAMLFLNSSYKNKMVNLIWGNQMNQSQHLVNQLKFPDLKLDFHCHSLSKYHDLYTYLNCQTSFSTIRVI